jgi:hypothetical protein
MPETGALLSAAERQAAVADDLGRSYAKELAAVKTDLERELVRLLVDAKKGGRTPIALAARALKLRRELRDMLADAGYDALADVSTVRGLERMAKAVERTRLAAQVTGFTSRDAARIQALKELARLDLLAQGDDVAIAVWRSVVQGVYSQRPVSEILGDLSDVLDKSLGEVGTLFDTQVSNFGQQVELLKSTGDPLERFAYFGPVDSKTRKFCMDRVGKIYTRADIDGMNNGQLPNCLITRGGYACRHHWIAVSKFSELNDLYGTGQRAPEVQAQLDALPPRLKRAA